MTEREPKPEHVAGRMRDALEAMMYIELRGCRCGARERVYSDAKFTSGLEHVPGDEPKPTSSFEITCQYCGLRRVIVFMQMRPRPDLVTRIDPKTGTAVRDHRHLGGHEHSEIIDPAAFARELLYCGSNFVDDTAALRGPSDNKDHVSWLWQAGHLCSNAETCINELRKFIPPQATEVPASHFATEEARKTSLAWPQWFSRAGLNAAELTWRRRREAIKAETLHRDPAEVPMDPKLVAVRTEFERGPQTVHTKVFGRHWSVNVRGIASQRFAAHADWLDGRGDERLRWEEADAAGARLDTMTLSGAIFAGGFFDRADFSSARLDATELADVRAHGANFVSATLAAAMVRRCSFVGANFAFADLRDATISGADFTSAQLACTTWHRAKVSRCKFVSAALHGAAFDHAEFVDCDFCHADLSAGEYGVLGTCSEAVFVRCDFRDSQWLDRNLLGARFVDCKFAGASGPPWLLETTFEGCEPSPPDIWGIPAFRPKPSEVEWHLPPEEIDMIATFLDSIGHPYRRKGTGVLSTQEPYGQQIKARVRDSLARYHRTLPPNVFAERVLDAAIDDKLSLDQTVHRLTEAGFSLDDAMEIMIDPASVSIALVSPPREV